MKSIIQSKKECFICRRKDCLNDHHIFFGTARRKISEANGFKVFLCTEHHLGTYGVHGKKGRDLNIYLKWICQTEYEKTHSREEFIKLIGESYL